MYAARRTTSPVSGPLQRSSMSRQPHRVAAALLAVLVVVGGDAAVDATTLGVAPTATIDGSMTYRSGAAASGS